MELPTKTQDELCVDASLDQAGCTEIGCCTWDGSQCQIKDNSGDTCSTPYPSATKNCMCK